MRNKLITAQEAAAMIHDGDFLMVADTVKKTISVYNSDNELVFVHEGLDYDDVEWFEDALVITLEVSMGSYKTFVFGDAVAEDTAKK